MKKIFYGAMALLLVAGCNNEDFSEQPVSTVKSVSTINAKIEETPVTRVHFENELKIAWNEGDVINVLSDIQTEATQFSYYGSSFTGDPVSVMNTIYAWYDPNGANDEFTTLDGDSKVLRAPNYEYQSFSNGKYVAPYMVAKGTADNLVFKQTGGILKFSITGSKQVTNVTLKSNDGIKIAGYDGHIDLKADEPLLEIDQSSSSNVSWISMDCDVSLQEDVATDFYFYVPAMTLAEGFTLTIDGKDPVTGIQYTMDKVSSESLTVRRGYLKSYAAIETEEGFVEVEDRQMEALTAFYNALDGEHWNNNSGWLTDAPLSEWYGLSVEDGKVVEIYLYNNNLTGDIPAEISLLSSLRYLSLGHNNILSLPESIGDIETLESLSLYSNQISEIPETVSKLKNLYNLDLENNKLTGEVPSFLSELTGLRTLWLDENSFTGELPVFLCGLRNLRNLYLNNNQFEGMIPRAYFADFENLYTLNVRYNNLSDTIDKYWQQSPMWQNLRYKYVREQNEGYGIEITGAVTGISVNTTNITLLVGESFQFEVTGVYPTDADNTETYWELESEYQSQYVSLENGKVTALKEGTAWVYVWASDNNGAYTTCRVQVVSSTNKGNTEDFKGEDDKWEK